MTDKALSLDPDYDPAKRNLKILNDIETGILKEPPKMETRYFYAEKLGTSVQGQ
jgi:hypothetical protein